MSRLLFPLLIVLLAHAGTLTGTSTLSFAQLATTAKRGGSAPPPDVHPGVIGVPPPTQPAAPDTFFPLDGLMPAGRTQAPAQPARRETAIVPAETSQAPASAPAQALPAPQATIQQGESNSQRGIVLNFSSAPIENVVRSIMEELGYTYVIDPDVSGTVNLFTMREIPRDRLFGVLEQLLKMNAQAVVKQGDFYIIVPIGKSPKVPHEILLKPEPPAPSNPAAILEVEPAATEPPAPPAEPPAESPQPPPAEPEPAPQETPPPQGQRQPAEGPVVLSLGPPGQQAGAVSEQGVITYIIPLNYLPSSDMLTMITPFVSEGATVIDFAPGNMLLVTDYHQNIQQVLNLVRLLDTQYFDINTIELVQIRHHKAEDVANDLAKIFAPGERATGVRIVAVERLNSLLVITHSPSVLTEVRKWVGKLDAPSTNTNIKTFVYQVENNTAMNIAEVLAQLYEDGQGLPSGATSADENRRQQGAAPPLPQREAGFLGPFDRNSQFGGGMGGPQLGPSLGSRNVQAGIRAVVSGNVKIIVNEFNNSLIVQATEADYNFLLETIKQLDVLPRQVLIEAKIYSVELRDDLNFGVAAFLQRRGAGATNGVLPPATTGSFQPPGQNAAGGLSLATRALVGDDRQLDALLTALRNETNVEILEAPRLLAMDGMQAQINIGAEVPVTTASFGDPLRSGSPTSFINSIQFRSTGTTLLIVPRISASGIVTMDLAIEVSSPSGDSLTPTINRNYVTTSMIVKDGQTAAIGGIISDQYTLDKDRVPLLGDIPILGALFGQTVKNNRRAELIFLITPHVIRNLPTATELMLDFRRAMRNAYDFIERKEDQQHELIEKRRREELDRQIQ